MVKVMITVKVAASGLLASKQRPKRALRFPMAGRRLHKLLGLRILDCLRGFCCRLLRPVWVRIGGLSLRIQETNRIRVLGLFSPRGWGGLLELVNLTVRVGGGSGGEEWSVEGSLFCGG